MKKSLLLSLVLAATFTGCGDSGASCCDGTSKINVKGNNTPPVATITNLVNNTTINVGETITINGTTSNDRDGQVTGYKWKLDGDQISTLANPTITFNTPGSHEVCLTVVDNDNLDSQNVECRTVIVKPAQQTANQPVIPTAVISLDDNGQPLTYNSNYTFSCANSHDNDTLGTGPEIVACDWDIQSYRIVNGVEVPYRDCSATNEKEHPIHICKTPERVVTRIVTILTVTDNDGQKHSTTKEYTRFQ